jgi:hypothetical protein
MDVGTRPAPAGARPAGTGAEPAPIFQWSAPAVDSRPVLTYANVPLALGSSDTTPRTAENRESTRAPAKHGGGRPSPAPPSGPPGGVGAAGSGAGAGGGASTALFCAILVVLLAYPVQELRRHRFRLVLAAPVGVVFAQQRPG